MKSNYTRPHGSAAHGFTLVELLVVIAIIAALSAVALLATRKFQERSQATKRLSDIRQAGSLLMGAATEESGRFSFFFGGSNGFEYRPYLIVRGEMGISNNTSEQAEIMFWDRKKRPSNQVHWNCRAVNFQTVTNPDGTTTRWVVKNNSNGTGANLRHLHSSAVGRPGLYPLLIDSSNASGAEIFRIQESQGECVGLREAAGTKAGAFLFDGSARHMDKAELKKAGFTKAYDNSTTPPKSLTL